MTNVVIWQVVSAVLTLLFVLVVVVMGRRREGAATLAARLEGLAAQQDRVDRSLREQLATARQEQGAALRDVRDEVGSATRGLQDSLQAGLTESGRLQQT